jgi:uncharacterized repeat protein (TIGR03803 family)
MKTQQAIDRPAFKRTAWVTAAWFFVILLSIQAEPTYTVLKSFGSGHPPPVQPDAPLIQGSDGNLYGTSPYAVFKIGADGSNCTVLHEFGGSGDGIGCYAALLEGSDGVLYGTTYLGGSVNNGTVFKLNKDGSGYKILYQFAGAGDGQKPYAALVEGTDGTLYGTTKLGGPGSGGTIFKLRKDGSGYGIIRYFTFTYGSSTDGCCPSAPLLKASDGMLYGTTQSGGTNSFGTIFRMNTDGQNYGILHHFGGFLDGRTPDVLTEAEDGTLFGTTEMGGTNSYGTVFKLNKDGTGYAVLHHFAYRGLDGQSPYSGVIEADDGLLYGTTQSGGASGNCGTVFRLNEDGSGYTNLHNFGTICGDGSQPVSGLIQTADGTFYGTTSKGGYLNFGIIFKLDNGGTGYSIFHEFSASVDGNQPWSPVIQASDGVLYGTAYGGIAGDGVVYKLNSDGSGYSIIHHFGLDCAADGINPDAAVIEGSDGALYGTTYTGGSDYAGTVFKLNKDGSGFTVLLSEGSENALIEGSDGALYGTAYYGGLTNANSVFKLNKDGSGYTILHHFTGGTADGSGPDCGLAGC